MRRRWYYFKRMLQADRRFVVQMFGNLLGVLRYAGLWIGIAAVCAAVLYLGRKVFSVSLGKFYEDHAVQIADDIVRGFLPAWKEDEGVSFFRESRKNENRGLNAEYEEIFGIENENEAMRAEWIAGREAGEEEYRDGSGKMIRENGDESGQLHEERAASDDNLLASGIFNTGNSGIILEKLNDYDYLMKKFYNVHPTTTASRDLMQAETFLSTDLSIEKNADSPQILIYHTHSQETYADYPENPEADVIHLGEELAVLLRERGYNVFHDESVYDYRDGKLDRSAAYTYALDGITGLLQKYPSIEVVLDIHRDGVADGTRLVTELGGSETAKLMFFNGTSMSPDGPIEYLPNPNLRENLAFSFQMQLLADGKYPGLMRKIYLKGLRYNEHVRARSALIEVGAQTNTYAEAKAAMEPLADILDLVLDHGQGD